ncbi:hypothetical protein KEM55_003463 [Ascosphaera atra]|nr:hypothetical protein KEM55_003463 [Ascosphaera atra]
MAHSPRTTRRNMLASELTESLRRHLLWERQQKGGAMGVANNPIANLTRRHTTHNVAGLTEFPGVGDNNNNTETADDDDDDPYDDDFYGSEYHTKGW